MLITVLNITYLLYLLVGSDVVLGIAASLRHAAVRDDVTTETEKPQIKQLVREAAKNIFLMAMSVRPETTRA